MRYDENTPVWLLDVDDVINCDKPGWSVKPHTGIAYARETPWPMRWAPTLLDKLRYVADTGLAEIRWCTTWCEEDAVRGLEKMWSLGPWTSAVPNAPYGTVRDGAKMAAALDVVRHENRPLVWTDDTAVPTHGVHYVELTNGGRALLIRPSHPRGLLPTHVAQIIEFCERMKSG